MGVSVSSLLWVEEVTPTAIVLFGLGIGWNLSFVAATAQLADCATAAERGKLLGFNDLLAGLTGAGLALLGGARAVGDRRGRARDRRHRARGPPGAVDPRPPAAGARRRRSGSSRAVPQHPQHVAGQDPLGVGGAVAVAERGRQPGEVVGALEPAHVGLMKPSKSEPIAACRCEPVSSRRRSAWRAITSKDSVERLRLLARRRR